MIKSKFGNDFFNVFKTIVFLEKEIKRQEKDKNHNVNKLISNKKFYINIIEEDAIIYENN